MTTSPRRRFRLQFSLRVLLALMFLLGVGLAIYRWPWVETKQRQIGNVERAPDIADYRTITTYRRGWNGQPMRHGLEQLFRNQKLIGEANYYDGEQHGRSRRYTNGGKLVTEVHYHSGQLYGPFRTGAGQQWTWIGNYVRNQPDGEWRYLTEWNALIVPRPPTIERLHSSQPLLPETSIPYRPRHLGKRPPPDMVWRIQHWRRGLREGIWRWETPTGEVLHQAEFRDDVLVRWNSQPVVEQFWQWLKEAKLHPETRQLLLASRTARVEQTVASASELQFQVQGEAGEPDPKVPLVVYIDAGEMFSGFSIKRECRELVSTLCELACENGYAFDCRYGTLWLVPHVDPAPEFVDPTGVLQIEFDEGSPQARDWQAELAVCENWNYAPTIVEQIFEGTSIRKQESIFQGIPFDGRQPPPLLYHRSRRDALGFVLYRAGYQCEYRGGELVLRHRAGKLINPLFERPLTPAAPLSPFDDDFHSFSR